MTRSPLFAALLAVATVLSALGAVDGLRRRNRQRRQPQRLGSGVRVWHLVGGAVGSLVGAVTGWPVAAVLVFAAIVWLPPVLAGGRSRAAAVARLEAFALWPEAIRNSLRASAGLEQAIAAASRNPPAAIAGECAAFVTELDTGIPLSAALPRLAARLADPLTDEIITCLLMAADTQAGRLADTLSTLARTAREHVTARLDTDAERAGSRTEMRMVVAVTVLLVGGLALLRPEFLAPYHSVVGQVILAVDGGLFTLGFVLMHRMAAARGARRVLVDPATTRAEVGR